jgi:undecaprenyl-diphosphatase
MRRFFAWFELPVLVLIAASSAAVWAFVEIAEEVMEGESGAFDERLLRGLRNRSDLSDPLGPRWVEEMARDVTALGGVAVLTLIATACVVYLAMVRKRHAALFLLVAVGGGMALSSAFKATFDRARPDIVAHLSHVYTASFPSGHSMMAAVVYLTLGALLARMHQGRAVKAFFLAAAACITVLVGVSRVYLGVHWPTDVLAGWSAGAAWAIACWIVALKFQRRGAVEPALPS